MPVADYMFSDCLLLLKNTVSAYEVSVYGRLYVRSLFVAATITAVGLWELSVNGGLYV